MSNDLVKRLMMRLQEIYDRPHDFSNGQKSEAAGLARDRIEELEAKLAKAVEALTPSGATKAAYIGEVETDCPSGRCHTVSWIATKDIMKIIMDRAELMEVGGKDV